MIIAARGAGNREVRFGELSAFIPPPGSSWSVESSDTGSSWDGHGGLPLGLRMTTVAAAIRLVSETIASFVMRTYVGAAQERQPKLDSAQAILFQEPGEGLTSFDLWSDTSTSIEVAGNAFTWKVVVAGEVVELFPLPPGVMCVRRERRGGPKIIEAWMDGKTVNVTRNVIHTRGWSPIAAASGASTLGLHQRSLRGAQALEDYRGRYFQADATPNIVLTHPGMLKADERADLRASWNARHAGPYGDKVGVLWGGMTATQLSSSLADSQAAALSEYDVRDIARMFRIFPAALLAAETDSSRLPSAETISDLFLRFSLLPRLRRIERSFSADRDVFPDRTMYARFDVSELLRGDIATTASKLHQLKQVGMISANEGRAEIGYPPVAGGDELQETPVGGAPNQNALNAAAEAGARLVLNQFQQLSLPFQANGNHDYSPADSTA